VLVLPDYLCDLYKSFGSTLDRFHDECERRPYDPSRAFRDCQDIEEAYSLR
jgi:hypothetical protein